MAFRASSQIKTAALSEIKLGAIGARAMAIRMRNTLAAGDTSGHQILNLLENARTLINRWNVLSVTPGLSAYAADQENDGAYDVVAEFTAMRNALTAVRDRIISDLPVASSPPGVVGRLAIYTLNPAGELVSAMFSPAQTANLRIDLDAFIATVT